MRPVGPRGRAATMRALRDLGGRATARDVARRAGCVTPQQAARVLLMEGAVRDGQWLGWRKGPTIWRLPHRSTTEAPRASS